MFNLKGFVAIILALGLTLGIVACGSSSSSDSSSSEATTSETTTSGNEESGGGASGEPIRLGAICNCSAPEAAAQLSKWPTMVEAWESYTNENGGINGHPVEVTVMDDAGDAAKSLAAAKKLVGEGVLAISDGTVQDASWQKYVEGKGVPVLCGVLQPDCWTSPNFFPQVSTIGSLIYGFLSKAVEQGNTKFGVVYCAEAPVCEGYPALTDAVLKNVIGKGSVVYSGKIAANAPDYTAQCLAASEAGVEALWPTHAPDINARVISDCKNQGYEPVVVNCCGSAGSPTENYGGESAIYTQPNLPISSEEAEGAKLLHSIMEQFAPDLKVSEMNDYTVPLWSGLQVFAKVGEEAKLTPTSTPEDVKNGLYGLKDETVGGLTPPLNYVKGQPTAINCWFNEGVEGGEQVASSLKPECVPQGDVNALNEATGG